MDDTRPPVDFQDILGRRGLLTPLAVTSGGDSVTTLESTLSVDGSDIGMRVRYVPDRATLDPASVPAYLMLFQSQNGMALETVARTVLEDITDQIIPCWIEVRLRRRGIQAGIEVGHEVRIEDRQPRWKGADILSRLAP